MRIKDTKTGRFTSTDARTAKRRAEILSDVKGLPVMGYTVYWSLPKMKIGAPELEAYLNATISTKYMPRKPIKKRALVRALRELKHLEDAGLITKVRDDAKCVAYVITEEVVNKTDADEIGTDSIDFEMRTIVMYDKFDGRLKFNKTLNAHAKALQDLYEEFTDVFTTEDVRKIVLEWVKDQSGVTLRESGGIYFVPVETSLLDTFLTAVGGTLYALPMLDCGTAKKQMYTVIKYEIENSYEMLAEEIKHLASKGKTSELVFKRRLEEFKDLRLKINAYKDLLRTDADVIESKITELEEEVVDSITGLVKDYENETNIKYGAEVIWKTTMTAEQRGGKESTEEKGVVVVYSKHKKGFTYVKVQLNASGRIQHVSPNTLTMVTDESNKEQAPQGAV